MIIISSLLIVLKRNEVQEYTVGNSYSFLLKHYDKDDIRLYSIMEDGGYGMFLGVKSYLDCRAEYFIKYNNKKYDILKEYFLLQHSKININEFLTVRIILSLLIFIISIYYFNSGYFIAPILTFLFYIFFEYICIDVKIKKRARKLESDAIFFFEVLNLTIQSERNLKLCISITSKSIDSDLSTEFKRMIDEVGYGKSLTEGLRDLMKRIPSKSVCNVILNIIEANEFGNSIEGALTNQINYLTDKRILDIKESINKMPMKISIISVLLFLPLMMLLILGPIFINYILK